MKAYTFDGSCIELETSVTSDECTTSVRASKNLNFENIKSVVCDEFALAGEGHDHGYFVFPRGKSNDEDYSISIFENHREDFKREIKESNIPIFGFKNGDEAVLGIVCGMKFDYTLIIKNENGKYYIYPRFETDGEQPYEDIEVKFVYLTGEDANYSGMARAYRKYLLDNNVVVPLKERAEKNEILDYSARSVMIRIRQAWKPCPSPVSHQTLENEPPMHVACTFERVKDIVDGLKAKGVKKAELCLVGWNVKGHDGRWPQPFPVEPELGGEEKLRELIQYTQKAGYHIVCHTNSCDQYEISDMYSISNRRHLKDGSNPTFPMNWSGGCGEEICPKIAWEQAQEILPKVAALGFKGLHYVDVVAVVHPRKCYNPAHKINAGEAAMYNRKIMQLSKELFGGFSSEGAYDFAAEYNDYGLYISFNEASDEIADKSIPLWQLIYHGITLSNPYATTVNYTIKDERTKLKLIEYGGRPSYYYYSKFVNQNDTHNNWMGNTDITCNNEDDLNYSLDKIKEGYDEYEKLVNLQFEFMEKHEEISDGVFEITYSNGTVITVDYNKNEYTVKEK